MMPGDLVVKRLDVNPPHLYTTLDQVGFIPHAIHRVEHTEVLLVLAVEPATSLRVLLFSARGRTYGWARKRCFIAAPTGVLQ